MLTSAVVLGLELEVWLPKLSWGVMLETGRIELKWHVIPFSREGNTQDVYSIY